MSYWGNRKPDFGLRCGIDWGHPLARGLFSALLNGFDLVQNDTRPSGVVLGQHGEYHLPVNIPSAQCNFANYTFVGAIKYYASTDNWSMPNISYWVDANNNFRFGLIDHLAGSISAQIRVNSNFVIAGEYTGLTSSGWRWWEFAPFGVTYNGAQLVRYERGIAQQSAAFSAVSLSSSKRLSRGVRVNYGGAYSRYQYWYNRGLSADEMAWLYAEPYAMIQAPEIPIFYSIPAGVTIYSRRGISNRVGTRTVWL